MLKKYGANQIEPAQDRDHCADCCEYGDDPGGTIKGQEFSGRLSDR